jgi:hypothetical protein
LAIYDISRRNEIFSRPEVWERILEACSQIITFEISERRKLKLAADEDLNANTDVIMLKQQRFKTSSLDQQQGIVDQSMPDFFLSESQRLQRRRVNEKVQKPETVGKSFIASNNQNKNNTGSTREQNAVVVGEKIWNSLKEYVQKNQMWKYVQKISKKPLKSSRTMLMSAVEALTALIVKAASEDVDGMSRKDVALILQLLIEAHSIVEEQKEKSTLTFLQRNIHAIALVYNDFLFKIGISDPRIKRIVSL